MQGEGEVSERSIETEGLVYEASPIGVRGEEDLAEGGGTETGDQETRSMIPKNPSQPRAKNA